VSQAFQPLSLRRTNDVRRTAGDSGDIDHVESAHSTQEEYVGLIGSKCPETDEG